MGATLKNAAAAALLVTVAASTASPVAHASSEPTRLCAWKFQPNEPFPQHGAVIVGGYAECPTAPEALSVRLRLWFRPSGGTWMPRGDDSTSLPSPHLLNFAVRSLDCATGLWQGEYDMAEVAGGYTRRENGKSLQAIITC
ncbi:hypothetical protein [Nocardia iowensis]|uniref:Secreted protein n=1 Tax=Nocardia iowensis TaxID=204891 RepID=A0ABX8RMW6_NOCIO|nr:hypothetical protein [Nocardia iowensis]QXN88741.1 hypothetical protein KV110_24475 [Nocardia iowensis]